MRLTDIMSSMGLSNYAELAMVLFMFAFLIIAGQVFFFRRADAETAAGLPLDDGQLPKENQRSQA